MFQDRRNSWTGKVLALGLVLLMLGAVGLSHLIHHLPSDEDSEGPWECFQCKVAENTIGDLGGLAICFGLSNASEFLMSWDETGGPFSNDPESASPRAPPALA
jgi:hypothetical protein